MSEDATPYGEPPIRARKTGGSFEADGTIIARFKTTSGQERVVFEFDCPKGMLHIYRPDQLTPLP